MILHRAPCAGLVQPRMGGHELLFVEDLHGFLRGTQPEGLVHKGERCEIEAFQT